LPRACPTSTLGWFRQKDNRSGINV
jgi:hypothetical protein